MGIKCKSMRGEMRSLDKPEAQTTTHENADVIERPNAPTYSCLVTFHPPHIRIYNFKEKKKKASKIESL